MKHFFIIGNTAKPGVEEVSQRIISYLTMRGASCSIGMPDQEKRPEYRYTDPRNVPEDTECVITLGGDGTLIQAARDLSERNIPMIGINLGHLGYLAQISELNHLEVSLEDLLTDNFSLEHRMRLAGTVYRTGEDILEDQAFNEIVITRKGVLRLIHFCVYVNGEFLSEYHADGLIVATPSGSTAYNMSAGGPIVEPHAQMLILTPVCPHELNGRSIVLSAEDRVEIEMMGQDDQEYMAYFDGDTGIVMQTGSRILVEKSRKETVLIKLRHGSFLETLRHKLAAARY